MQDTKILSENENLLRNIRHNMTCFFEGKDISRISLGITSMECSKDENGITLTITLERPGLLIGKGGRTIDALNKYLDACLEIPVEIKIVEDKTWHW